VTERILVVNADDLGLTPGVSAGIVDAHRDGIVTSASLLAVAPGFGDAVARLGDAPDLGVGVHLAVVGEDPPLLGAREVPSLVGRRGDFRRSWRQFLPRAAAGQVDPDDLRREFAAQIARVRAAGVTPTHLDTHQHLHLWPLVQRVVVDLAVSEGIPAVRVPTSAARSPLGLYVRRLATTLRRNVHSAGLAHPDDFAGLDEAGALLLEPLTNAVDRLGRRGGRSAEIGCHPGRADDPERRRYRWGYAWPDELAALCSPTARTAVERAGFRLGSFAAL